MWTLIRIMGMVAGMTTAGSLVEVPEAPARVAAVAMKADPAAPAAAGKVRRQTAPGPSAAVDQGRKATRDGGFDIACCEDVLTVAVVSSPLRRTGEWRKLMMADRFGKAARKYDRAVVIGQSGIVNARNLRAISIDSAQWANSLKAKRAPAPVVIAIDGLIITIDPAAGH